MIISAIQAGYKCLKFDAEGQNLAGEPETCTKMSDKLKLTAIKISEKYLWSCKVCALEYQKWLEYVHSSVIYLHFKVNKCGVSPGNNLLNPVASVAKLHHAPAHITPWGW